MHSLGVYKFFIKPGILNLKYYQKGPQSLKCILKGIPVKLKDFKKGKLNQISFQKDHCGNNEMKVSGIRKGYDYNPVN